MKSAACKRLPVDADPMLILEGHERKMVRKAKPRQSMQFHKVTANLSKRHRNHGKHPTQAY